VIRKIALGFATIKNMKDKMLINTYGKYRTIFDPDSEEEIELVGEVFTISKLLSSDSKRFTSRSYDRWSMIEKCI